GGGDKVAVPDLPQPQRLVGPGEIPVRGVEILVNVLARLFDVRAPGAEQPLDFLPIPHRVLDFDFQHGRPAVAARTPGRAVSGSLSPPRQGYNDANKMGRDLVRFALEAT